jgi:hypothetical protein
MFLAAKAGSASLSVMSIEGEKGPLDMAWKKEEVINCRTRRPVLWHDIDSD